MRSSLLRKLEYSEIKTSRRNLARRFNGHVMRKTFIIGLIFNVPLQTKTAFLGPLNLFRPSTIFKSVQLRVIIIIFVILKTVNVFSIVFGCMHVFKTLHLLYIHTQVVRSVSNPRHTHTHACTHR